MTARVPPPGCLELVDVLQDKQSTSLKSVWSHVGRRQGVVVVMESRKLTHSLWLRLMIIKRK